MPLTRETLYQGWLKAVNNHEFMRAEKFYMRLLKFDPSTPGINFPMGVWYKEKGLWDKARAAFLRALDTDPHILAETYYYLGNVARERKEYKEAISYYQKSIKIDPEFSEAYYNLGKVYAVNGQSKEALEAFIRARELNPQDMDTYLNIGVELSNQGKRKEALEMYERALALNPNSYVVYSNIGVEYTLLGDYEKAITYHKKALAFNSFYGDGWYNLACTYARANNLEGSLSALEKAIRLDEENIQYAKNDPELENTRNTPEFRRIVNQEKF